MSLAYTLTDALVFAFKLGLIGLVVIACAVFLWLILAMLDAPEGWWS